jgi:hypothetical protein
MSHDIHNFDTTDRVVSTEDNAVKLYQEAQGYN